MNQQIAEQIARVLAGEREAMAWLYDAFAPRLFRRLRQRYGAVEGDEAEDILQDLFLALLNRDGHLLRLYLDRSNGPDAASLERFLWDQACGLASNRRRSRSRRPVVPFSTVDLMPLAPSAERAVVERDRLERLVGCLEAVGGRVYLYFQLRYRDGLSPEEIGQVTGWSRKATYKLKQSLNQALERCVTRWDGDKASDRSSKS